MKPIDIAILAVIAIIAGISGFCYLLFIAKKDDKDKKENSKKNWAESILKWEKPQQAFVVSMGMIILLLIFFWEQIKSLQGWALAALIIIALMLNIGGNPEKTIARSRKIAVIIAFILLSWLVFWPAANAKWQIYSSEKASSADQQKQQKQNVALPKNSQKKTPSLPPDAIDTGISASPGERVFVARSNANVPAAKLMALDESGTLFFVDEWTKNPKKSWWILNNTGTEKIKIFLAPPKGWSLKDYRISVSPFSTPLPSTSKPAYSPPQKIPCPFS